MRKDDGSSYYTFFSPTHNIDTGEKYAPREVISIPTTRAGALVCVLELKVLIIYGHVPFFLFHS